MEVCLGRQTGARSGWPEGQIRQGLAQAGPKVSILHMATGRLYVKPCVRIGCTCTHAHPPEATRPSSHACRGVCVRACACARVRECMRACMSVCIMSSTLLWGMQSGVVFSLLQNLELQVSHVRDALLARLVLRLLDQPSARFRTLR